MASVGIFLPVVVNVVDVVDVVFVLDFIFWNARMSEYRRKSLPLHKRTKSDVPDFELLTFLYLDGTNLTKTKFVCEARNGTRFALFFGHNSQQTIRFILYDT